MPLVYEKTKVCEVYAVSRGMGFGGGVVAPDEDELELQENDSVEVEPPELVLLVELEELFAAEVELVVDVDEVEAAVEEDRDEEVEELDELIATEEVEEPEVDDDEPPVDSTK